MSNGKPSNLYPALKCIRHPIALVKTQYEKKYCDAKATKFTKWDVTGASNLEELKNHISPYFLQRTKEECLDLPPKSYVSIECESTVNIEAQYQENIAWIKSEYFERVKQGTISGTAEKIVFLGYFRKFASIFKTHETIKMVEELIDANESVTVFTEFKDSAFMIAEHFGIEALTGDTKVDDRQQIVEDFQSGINKVFVGTIKSAGIGITLTKAAYNIIVDFPWKPSDLEQTEDRTHRIGQNRNVTIYNIFGKDIDYVMAAILGKKSELIDSVLSKKGIDMSKKDDDGFLDILINKLIQNS
jgi:SWI/SNF-related matrix-associated actin-dependent regulator 1 of chromatin subfamily A